MTIGVGIIGCGLIGRKRAAAFSGARIVACADTNGKRADELASLYPGCVASADWTAILANPAVAAVVVATPHDALAEVMAAAIAAGKHVLVEKPAARHVSELRPLDQLASEAGVVVRVGFNHRYHRAFRQARQIVDAGALGPLMFLRARYGHGGRVGYDREWRADPAQSGGGELIDQGVHLVDLARWFLGDFVSVSGVARTFFWDMPVDDNAFLLLGTKDERVAWLHASCTEWKNTFSFELYGRDGKLHIDGLGGSYGTERLAYYKMLPSMGPPETTIWEYPMADDSWNVEVAEFLEDIRLGRRASPGLADAIATLDVVDRIYQMSGPGHAGASAARD